MVDDVASRFNTVWQIVRACRQPLLRGLAQRFDRYGGRVGRYDHSLQTGGTCATRLAVTIRVEARNHDLLADNEHVTVAARNVGCGNARIDWRGNNIRVAARTAVGPIPACTGLTVR